MASKKRDNEFDIKHMFGYNSQHMFCAQNENKGPNSERGNFVRFVGVFLVIMITSAGGFYVWDGYFSKEAAMVRDFNDYQEKVEEAYRNDTYGGKTPQETLDLFVEALKKEDVELASKYFALDDNLSRDKWIEFLQDLKNKNVINRFGSDLEDYSESKRSFEPYHLFIYRNNDNSVALQMNMIFYEKIGIWKIESL